MAEKNEITRPKKFTRKGVVVGGTIAGAGIALLGVKPTSADTATPTPTISPSSTASATPTVTVTPDKAATELAEIQKKNEDLLKQNTQGTAIAGAKATGTALSALPTSPPKPTKTPSVTASPTPLDTPTVTETSTPSITPDSQATIAVQNTLTADVNREMAGIKATATHRAEESNTPTSTGTSTPTSTPVGLGIDIQSPIQIRGLPSGEDIEVAARTPIRIVLGLVAGAVVTAAAAVKISPRFRDWVNKKIG